MVGIALDYSTGAATALSPTDVHARLEKIAGLTAPAVESGLFVFDPNGALLATLRLEDLPSQER